MSRTLSVFVKEQVSPEKHATHQRKERSDNTAHSSWPSWPYCIFLFEVLLRVGEQRLFISACRFLLQSIFHTYNDFPFEAREELS